MDNYAFPTACLAFLVLIASVISVEAALSAAIIETTAGVFASNVFGFQSPEWMTFLAGFGGILLTFLAGAEVDTALLRQRLGQNLLIGGFSFAIPFLAALFYCYNVAGWTWNASLIAGCTLSTTSIAIVYAVLVETGLSGTELGNVLMASTFVTNMGSVLALSLCFAQWSYRTPIVLLASLAAIIVARRVVPPLFERYGSKVIEPEIKLLFFLLFAFMALAKWGQVHAILPVFVLGLALARMFQTHKDLQRKTRIVAFAMITPFFFLYSGMKVSVAEVVAYWPLLLVLFAIKTVGKFIGVMPFARRYAKGHAVYFTLLMSTGLTFGNICASYGLQAGHITSSQFSVLVGVVILAALAPTFVAQRWFSPALTDDVKEELSAQEEESI